VIRSLGAIVLGLLVAACGASVPPSTPGPSGGGASPAGSTGSGTPTASAAPDGAPTASVPGSAASDPPDIDGPVPLRVVELGFAAFDADATGYAAYGALVENPNPDWAIRRMEVHVDFFDPDGAFLAGDDVIIDVLPGQTTAIAGQRYGVGPTARMEVNPPDDTSAFEPAPAPPGGLAVTDIATSRADGTTLTTGRLTSTLATDAAYVELVAISRDRSGAIVGGGPGGVDLAPAGTSVGFEILDAAPHDDIASTAVYWQVGG
jgi:hypothetical protein